jgi:hypothetical protein
MVCNHCKREPHEIDEYKWQAAEEWAEKQEIPWQDMMNAFDALSENDRNHIIDQWCWYNEGTMNWDNGHFLCTQGYIEAGMPGSPTGWTAP